MIYDFKGQVAPIQFKIICIALFMIQSLQSSFTAVFFIVWGFASSQVLWVVGILSSQVFGQLWATGLSGVSNHGFAHLKYAPLFVFYAKEKK